MSPHRGIPLWLIPVSCLVATVAVAQESPEKALKYHEVLLKRPHNAALFDWFFGAWLDEQPVEMLDAFLKARAQVAGGAALDGARDLSTAARSGRQGAGVLGERNRSGAGRGAGTGSRETNRQGVAARGQDRGGGQGVGCRPGSAS